MRILFYFPTSESSVSLETLMEEFSNLGHEVHLLGWEAKGPIHQRVEEFGVKTNVHQVEAGSSLPFYLNHLKYLVGYVKSNQIDLVYSHTQPVNFISVFAQYFTRAKFYICRHHSDYIMKGSNRNAKLFDRIINRLGRRFIVPSKKVFHQLVDVEGVNNKEVRLINYAYRFENYPEIDQPRIDEIRKEANTELLLCTVSRFIPCKRYDVLIKCIKDLVDEGLSLKLLILGNGPLEKDSRQLVRELGVEKQVVFVGFTREVLNYMAAADLIVHFSDSEASNSVVKEAGLLEKRVAVCEDVGDFDDYIQDELEGFKLDKENPSDDFKRVVRNLSQDTALYADMGKNLKASVLKNFSVENVIEAYSEVLPEK
jgi:glycosyltransferase involved in cell wall biosynthesis